MMSIESHPDQITITIKDRNREKAELQATNQIAILLKTGYRYPRITQKQTNGVTTITLTARSM